MQHSPSPGSNNVAGQLDLPLRNPHHAQPRLFYGNFEFEHELVEGSARAISPPARQLTALLATSWLLVAEEGDFIWTPETVPGEFWEAAALRGFPRVHTINNLSHDLVPPSPWQTLCPWGWSQPMRELREACSRSLATPELRKGSSECELPECTATDRTSGSVSLNPRSQKSARSEHLDAGAIPSLEAVRKVNARSFSFALEHEWGCGLAGARIVKSVEELRTGVEELLKRGSRPAESNSSKPMPDNGQGWLLKANFGMSGRESVTGHGLPGPREIGWLTRRKKSESDIFFLEPFVNRLEEAGMQWEVPPRDIGRPHLVGLTELWCDARGQFLGSVFSQDEDRMARWRSALEFGLRAAERAQTEGYFGPLGIDAMRYRSPWTDEIRIRPLQDINARWTMGRLSLGLRRLLGSNEKGVWLHLRRSQDSSSLLRPPSSCDIPWGDSPLAQQIREQLTRGIGRWIPTSPPTIGGRETTHETGAWIFERD